MPFRYQHPDYWRIISEVQTLAIWLPPASCLTTLKRAPDYRGGIHKGREYLFAKLFLVGAEDDALWDTAKYIRRMEKRLAEKILTPAKSRRSYMSTARICFSQTVCSDHTSRRLGTVCQAGVQQRRRRNIPGSVKRLALTLTAA